MADITVDQVKARFTEFAQVADATVASAIEEAYALTDITETITMLAIGHVLTLEVAPAGSERFGEVLESKVGPITTKHKTQARTEREVYFTRTEYGRRMLALEARNRDAVVVFGIG